MLDYSRAGASIASALVLVLAVTAAGCADDTPDTEPAAVVAPVVETFLTDATGIDKYKGFNEVYDHVQDSCLKRCGAEDLTPETHSDESELQIAFISTASEIANNKVFTLDAHTEMALHAGNVDANASMKLASSAKFGRRAVRMLLVARRTFKATYNETVQIDATKIDPDFLVRSKAANDAAFEDRLTQFIGRCGHVYVKETMFGAYLAALYEFTATDETKLQNLEAKLGAAFRSHVGKIGGGVNMGAQQELSQALSEVQWTVNVVARGFKVNGNEGEGEGKIVLQQGGQGGLDLQRIVTFFDSMQASVGADMKALKMGNLDHPKSVLKLGLAVGYYPHLVPSLPAEEVNTAKSRMSDIMNGHDLFLRKYGELLTAMIGARDEVARFMALGEWQETYQVMKWAGKPHNPAVKLRDNGGGLLDRVQPYQTALDPKVGESAANKLAAKVVDCWRTGRSGDLKRCLPDWKKGAETAAADPLFVAALGKLRDYNDKDRPAPLNYYFRVGDSPTFRAKAPPLCGADHLPSMDESHSMGLLANHRAPRNFPGRSSFWISEQNAFGCDGDLFNIFRYVGPDGYAVGCAIRGWKEPVACVLNAGLFPTLPLLYPAGGF